MPPAELYADCAAWPHQTLDGHVVHIVGLACIKQSSVEEDESFAEVTVRSWQSDLDDSAKRSRRRPDSVSARIIRMSSIDRPRYLILAGGAERRVASARGAEGGGAGNSRLGAFCARQQKMADS